jgi:hypothetical protein
MIAPVHRVACRNVASIPAAAHRVIASAAAKVAIGPRRSVFSTDELRDQEDDAPGDMEIMPILKKAAKLADLDVFAFRLCPAILGSFLCRFS